MIIEDVSIVIVDRTKQDKDVVKSVASALQKQAMEHFGAASPKGWGVSAKVRVETRKKPLLPGEWPLRLLPEKEFDIAGALGYHDESANGVPILNVCPELDAKDGNPWSITASHEVLEALADPWLGRCIQDEDGKIWSLEVCDAVEADHYDCDGVPVSNFVLPFWYEPPIDKKLWSTTKYDYLGLCKKPFEVRPGGYAQYLTAKGWKSTYEENVRAYRRTIRGRGFQRTKRIAREI